MKVWVNGTFDVLHVGHVHLLEYAASLGDLRVAIDSDKRVKELKGADRPFNTEEDRKKMLLALKCVDDVVIFDSRAELIQMVKDYEPDFMVIGDDYVGQTVYGSEYAKKLLFYEKLPEHSTSKILSYDKNIGDR